MRNVPQETAGLLVKKNQGRISLLVEKEAEKYYKLSKKFKNVSLSQQDLFSMYMLQTAYGPTVRAQNERLLESGLYSAFINVTVWLHGANRPC